MMKREIETNVRWGAIRDWRRLMLLAVAGTIATMSLGRDVFSDASMFRRGFADADANGLLTDGKTEFLDALKAGDAASINHTATHYGCSTGIVIRTETVCYPYAKVCREEPVAYFPQTVFLKEGSDDRYLISSLVNLTDSSPFYVTNANQYTFFIRYRWDGINPTNHPGVFLNAGWQYGNKYVAGDPTSGGTGFLLGVSAAGNLWCYGGRGGTSTTVNSAPGSSTVLSNEWTDCAIVVSNFQLTAYTYRTNFANIYKTSTISLSTVVATNYSKKIYLGGQDATTSDAGWTYSGSGNPWKVFRGSIHSFAAWPRALTLDEIRQVFAWPRTDLVRLGTANGSPLDLAGGTSAAATAGTPTEWKDTPAALSSSNPSFTVTFDVPAHDVGLGQVLRVIPTDDSDMGSLAVSVNGTAAGSLGIRPGRASSLYIDASRFVAGANTLQLTRSASSGTLRFDAIALGGGIQIGLRNSATGEFVQEQTQWVNYYPTDGNWKHVNRAIMAPTGANSTNRVHFFMPDELTPRHPIRFTACVLPSRGDYSATRDYPELQDLAIYVNDSPTPSMAGPVSRLKGWTNLVVEVSAEDVRPGDNVFAIVNESQKWWDDDFHDYAWTSIDCFRVEVLRESKGMAPILR